MKSELLLIGTLACALAATAPAAPRGGMGGFAGGGGGMMGGMPNAAKFSGAMAKVFGENTTFSADMESKTTGEQSMTIPGKMVFDSGKSRTEIDMTQAKGSALPPEMAEQMKVMGMDKMIAVSLPEKKVSYIIYPSMEAYVETDLSDPASQSQSQDYKVKTQELGRETLDGRPTIKNKVIVSDATNQVMEATVWNATDLKNFPLKVEQQIQGTTMITSFKNVKFEKPAASQFEVPANYKKYGNMMELMQSMVMKHMGGTNVGAMGGGFGGAGGMGMPPQGTQKRKNR